MFRWSWSDKLEQCLHLFQPDRQEKVIHQHFVSKQKGIVTESFQQGKL